jgi:hypothetical protein
VQKRQAFTMLTGLRHDLTITFQDEALPLAQLIVAVAAAEQEDRYSSLRRFELTVDEVEKDVQRLSNRHLKLKGDRRGQHGAKLSYDQARSFTTWLAGQPELWSLCVLHAATLQSAQSILIQNDEHDASVPADTFDVLATTAAEFAATFIEQSPEFRGLSWLPLSEMTHQLIAYQYVPGYGSSENQTTTLSIVQRQLQSALSRATTNPELERLVHGHCLRMAHLLAVMPSAPECQEILDALCRVQPAVHKLWLP